MSTLEQSEPFFYLIPFDFFNAAHDFNVAWRIDEEHRFKEFYVTRDVKPGEELLMSYGDYDNFIFLVNNGFFMKDNPFDMIRFAPDFPEIPSMELKNKIGSSIWPKKSSSIGIAINQTRDHDDLKLARFLLLKTENMSAWTISEILQNRSADPENELTVSSYVAAKCWNLLEGYQFDKPSDAEKEEMSSAGRLLYAYQEAIISTLKDCSTFYQAK